MVLHCVGMPKGFLVLQEFHFRPFGIVIACFGPSFFNAFGCYGGSGIVTLLMVNTCSKTLGQ